MLSPDPPAPCGGTADERWRVRVRDANGAVRGAGMLVCTGQVLTCAHVISDDTGPAAPDIAVSVEFVSLPDTPVVPAKVAAGGWVPISDDESGDIALLDLAAAPPAVAASPLRRLLGRGRSVHTFGFPKGAEQYGVNATAVLSGPGGPGGEWIQLDSPPDDRRVTSGFSGAGVVDQQTHAVIGMVVMEYVREQPSVSWMVPIETILRHVPGLARCVAGAMAVPSDWASERVPPPSGDFARKVARWFRRAGPPVRLVVAGEPGSSGLRGMSVLADRELRPPAARGLLAGTVPPVGSVDLATDASGMSVGELVARITERIGPTDARREPAAIVVDGVDDAADPEALLNELLGPLAGRGTRLLLGFRRESSRAWEQARTLWPGGDVPDDHPTVVRERLAELGARIGDIADREGELLALRDHVAERVSDVEQLRSRTFELRARLTAARGDTRRLDEAEEAAERARLRLDGFARSLHGLLERRRELRGRLEAYHAMAIDRGLAEDVRLDAHYRRAYTALRQRPCDLAVAARLIAEYRAAIRGPQES